MLLLILIFPISSRHVYLSQIPYFLHHYIDDIIDGCTGGNCDFRAIAALFGWDEKPWPLIYTQLDT